MTTADWPRPCGAGCGDWVLFPLLHCSNACERKDEARKQRPAPTSKPTLSVTHARQVMADESASNYAKTCAKNQAVRDARNQAW
jgi:hypothetical protein